MEIFSHHKINLLGLDIIGVSSAGVGTCFSIPSLDICFDVAQGLPYALTTNNYLITHGHMDHAGGIPYIISQKALTHQNPPAFYMPEILIEPLQKIMSLWTEIENHQYNYKFSGFKEKESFSLKGDYFAKTFQTVHRIPSLGYTVFKRHKKLKPEYKHLSPFEIIQLKKNKTQIENTSEIPLISFTGDTKIEFLESADWIKESQILILEVTYFDKRKSVEEARKWGHIHLDELIPLIDSIKSEKIVISHASRRYTKAQIIEIFEKKFSVQQLERIVLIPPHSDIYGGK